MKQISGALATALYSVNVHRPCDLYTLYLPGPNTQRWTTFDQSVTFGGNTWTQPAGGPHIVSRAKSRASNDGSVDTLDVEIAPGSFTTAGTSLFAMALAGGLNSVELKVERGWFDPSNPTTIAGTDVVFDGTIVEVDPCSWSIKLVVKSYLALLNLEIPKRQVIAHCPLIFGSTECSATVGTHSRTAAAGSTASSIVLNASSTMAMVGGTIIFTSGVLTGASLPIRAVAGATLTPIVPFPLAPAIGDGITVRQGCDKTRGATSGCAKYSNLPRFAGYPDQPIAKVMEGS